MPQLQSSKHQASVALWLALTALACTRSSRLEVPAADRSASGLL
jgi:hypothetical protein